LLATPPILKFEDHPLSAVQACLFDIFADTLHTRIYYLAACISLAV